jgi:hypothetical protein
MINDRIVYFLTFTVILDLFHKLLLVLSESLSIVSCLLLVLIDVLLIFTVVLILLSK